MIIIFEGPDMTGKTTIAKALAEYLDIPYFKNTLQSQAFLNWKDDPDDNFFLGLIKYSDPYFISYLGQSGASVVIDRAYPSEWVYSALFKRETDQRGLQQSDEGYAALGAKIVITTRSTYTQDDDLAPDILNASKITELDTLYDDFSHWTDCDTFKLNVDDEDIDAQISRIVNGLKLGVYV